MVSGEFGKPVLIDFGLAEIIAEECGEKTYTSFNGTPSFVSKEMLKLFNKDKEFGYVDLYYNDLVCFQKTKKLF